VSSTPATTSGLAFTGFDAARAAEIGGLLIVVGLNLLLIYGGLRRRQA
jgi:hypothetical protein